MVAQALSAVALLLLAASGALKIRDPEPTRGALHAAHLPSARWVTRSLGAAEISAASLGLLLGGPWLLPASLLYTGFLLFTLFALGLRLPLQSCGCFGSDDTPPTWAHAVFNGLSAVAMWYLVAVDATPIPRLESPAHLALFLGFALTGAYLSYLLLSQLPRTLQMTSDR